MVFLQFHLILMGLGGLPIYLKELTSQLKDFIGTCGDERI